MGDEKETAEDRVADLEGDLEQAEIRIDELKSTIEDKDEEIQRLKTLLVEAKNRFDEIAEQCASMGREFRRSEVR